MIINKSLYPNSIGFNTISNMQSRFDTLQMQLATGKRAQTIGELGEARSYDLTLHSRRSRVEGFQNSIQMVDLRLTFLSNAVSRIDEIEAETRTAISPGGYGSDNVNVASAPAMAETRLEELVALLNSEVNGRYLFGGNETDNRPVATVSAMLDGEAGKAGFRTVMSERLAADQGTSGLGRLTLSTLGTATTVSEDGAHPFGLKLSTLSTDSPDITLSGPSGSPGSLTVDFTGPGSAGETVRVGFTLPDGNDITIALKAVTGTPGEGEFQVGAGAAAASANFAAALQSAIAKVGSEELVGASAYAAAENFFAGNGETPMRVSGPAATATSLVAATDADTVMWYRGEDNADPRRSVSARVDESVAANYGVQANERGFTELVRSLAAMAATSFPESSTTNHERFDYMAKQQQARLADTNNGSGASIEVVALELGLAKTTVNAAQERHTQYKMQLDTMIAGLEEVSIEEVAMEIKGLQTRLQASFQTISLISDLTLVNYVR